MTILEHVSLKEYNTFGIDISARYFLEVHAPESLRTVFSNKTLSGGRHIVLGGGSNVLFTGDFDGLVLRMCNKGKQVVAQQPDSLVLKVQAGEEWDALVEWCVGQGWGGLENLSLIPGQVGTSPMQNIGAYGVELKDVFHSLEAFEKKTGELREFDSADCRFGYRDSFFKGAGRDRFVITSVCLKLSTRNHRINTSYGALSQELEQRGINDPGIRDVRQAVVAIRQKKLPDPEIIGNAGSFFKNPVVSLDTFERLQKAHPGLVAFPEQAKMKLAAGWLIEQAGWKGYRKGDAGVHDRQALVLVNHGNASGREVAALGMAIKASVMEQFSVELETEVNII
jgi:UDP-N-acetylmuramate dehydrogenase